MAKKPKVDPRSTEKIIYDTVSIMGEHLHHNSIKIMDVIFTVKEREEYDPEYDGTSIYMSREELLQKPSLVYWTLLRRCFIVLYSKNVIKVTQDIIDFARKNVGDRMNVLFQTVSEWDKFLIDITIDGYVFKLQAYTGDKNDYLPYPPETGDAVLDNVNKAIIDIRRQWLTHLQSEDINRSRENAKNVSVENARLAAEERKILSAHKASMRNGRTPTDAYSVDEFTSRERDNIDKFINRMKIKVRYGDDIIDRVRAIICVMNGSKSLIAKDYTVKKKIKLPPDKVSGEEKFKVVSKKTKTDPELIEAATTNYREYAKYLREAVVKYDEAVSRIVKDECLKTINLILERAMEHNDDLKRPLIINDDIMADIKNNSIDRGVEHKVKHNIKKYGMLSYNDKVRMGLINK